MLSLRQAQFALLATGGRDGHRLVLENSVDTVLQRRERPSACRPVDGYMAIQRDSPVRTNVHLTVAFALGIVDARRQTVDGAIRRLAVYVVRASVGQMSRLDEMSLAVASILNGMGIAFEDAVR